MKGIKNMRLYHQPQRIYEELMFSHQIDNAKLKVEDLSSHDQYHYLGTAAVDDAIESLNIESEDIILDIGSGIGGPARYVAHKTGCQVIALELQYDLHKIATNLTERCGLSGQVEHRCGDILTFPEEDIDFDYIVSWLCFLHIKDRDALFRKCFNVLNPGGEMYIEDFYKVNEFNDKEMKVLSEDIYCDYLPSSSDYQKQLIEKGFSKIEFKDKTNSWKDFVRDRKDNFIQNREQQMKIHNPEIVEELEDFYKKMSWLYEGGNLGGAKIIASK